MLSADQITSQGTNQLRLIYQYADSLFGDIPTVVGVLGILLMAVVLGTSAIWCIRHWSLRKKHYSLFVLRTPKGAKLLLFPLLFVLALLAIDTDASLPYSIETANQVDRFFMSVCLVSLCVSLLAFCAMLATALDDYRLNNADEIRHQSLRRSILLQSALSCWALGFMVHFIGLYAGASQSSLLSCIGRPAFAASKMFVLSDSFTEMSPDIRTDAVFVGTYVFARFYALIVSAATFLTVLGKRFTAYMRLRRLRCNGKQMYVFFSLNTASKMLAQDIRRCDPRAVIMLIDTREKQQDGGMFSFNSILGMFGHNRDLFDLANQIDAYVMLAGVEMYDYQLTTIDEKRKMSHFEQLELKALPLLIKNASSASFFFLGQDENRNIHAADNFRRVIGYEFSQNAVADDKFHIYVHARTGANSRILNAPLRTKVRPEIHVLDSSRMAVQSLLRHPECHPVNFVSCDKQSATVHSPFHALVLGFGETGEDMVRFLYEFGSFLDSSSNSGEPQRSPFRCDVVDADMDVLAARFLHKLPALKRLQTENSRVQLHFHHMKLHSKPFYELLDKQLPLVNYIVLTTGSDQRNMDLCIQLMELLAKRRTSTKNVVIVMRNYSSENYDTMKSLAEDCNRRNDLLQSGASSQQLVYVFGSKVELFSYDLVVSDYIQTNAQIFKQKYEQVRASYLGEKAAKLIDKVTEIDCNNFLHINTKLLLMGVDVRNLNQSKDLYNQLLESARFQSLRTEEGLSFVAPTDAHLRTLWENLAKNDYLRWYAANELQMVDEGDAVKVDATQLLRHYLVVDTTLRITQYNAFLHNFETSDSGE